MPHDKWLAHMSGAIQQISEDRERLRQEHDKLLGEPILYMSDTEDHRFGVGWFRVESGYVAYRKNANGYEMYQCASITDDLLRALFKHLEPTTVEHAAMYGVLREMNWHDSPLAVVQNPMRAVKLGEFCPFGDQLDELLRPMIKE